MNVIPFVHEGLGNSSYVTEVAPGEAIVVDPDRSVRRYLQAAEGNSLRLTGVLETHVHADFVTGAIEIAAATGATIFNPDASGVRYSHRPVSGGETIRLGETAMEVLATPGHTPEHTAYVLRAPGSEPLLFSGGSVIVGGAARTDLLGHALEEGLTRSQYHTLRESFVDLPDTTVLYPTHGGGSFCSAGALSQRSSTLGEQRAMNPAMSEMAEEEFLDWFPRSFPGVPKYYARMRDVNQAGPRLRTAIAMPPALTPAEFEAAARTATLIDTRPSTRYLEAHIPGSLSNPFRDVFGVWMGWLVDLETPLLFVVDDGDVDTVVDECLLVGHENFAGFLAGGLRAWEDAGLKTASIRGVSAEEADDLLKEGVAVLDVREPDEFAVGHMPGAVHVPLGDLADEIRRVPRGRPVLAYCGAGSRSSSAVSLLERAGIGPVYNLQGGFTEWAAAGHEVAIT